MWKHQVYENNVIIKTCVSIVRYPRGWSGQKEFEHLQKYVVTQFKYILSFTKVNKLLCVM